MTQRLPIPGSDTGEWGYILNGFLGVAHNSDGTLVGNSVSAAGAEMVANKGATNGYAPLNSSSLVPTSNLGSGTASSSNYLRGDGIWVVPPTGVALDTTASDIQPLGTQASGSVGKAADAGHVHTMPTASQVGALPSTDDLSAIATANATASSVSLNSHKITNLANGTTSNDAAAFGQIPVAGTTAGTYAAGNDSRITGAIQSGTTAGGDLSGTLPSPTVARVNGVSVTGTPSTGQAIIATSGTAAAWGSIPGAANATTSSTGLVQLAGDLGGTGTAAAAPTLANTANVQSVVNSIVGTSYAPLPKSATGQVVTATSATEIATINASGLPGYATPPGTALTVLKGDNSTNDQTALQALVNYLTLAYAATGVAQIIYCPAGEYSIRDNGTVWTTGVGLVGDGPNRTIFKLSNPVNTTNPTPLAVFTVAFNSASTSNYLSDCVFAGFTIDGSGVSLSSYTTGPKGLGMQYMVRPIFKDLIIQNCGASGLGCDFQVDAHIENVHCYNNGRLNSGSQAGGAGFGIGTGGWTGTSFAEGGVIIGCESRGNGTHGLFFELQNASYTLPKGWRVVGGRYQGNQFGISDWGCDGLAVDGAVLTGNLQHGFTVNANGVAGVAGTGGIITGCTVDGNGLDGVCLGDTAGRYTVIGNRISNNGRHGYHALNVVNSASTGIATMSISDNDIYGNGYCGIRIDALLNNPFILVNRVRDNAIQAAGPVSNSGGTVTYTALTVIDTAQAWTANSQVGKTVTVGSQTALVQSNTATTLTLWPHVANGTTAWTTGTPSAGTAYSLPAAPTDRAGMTFNQAVNHPVVRANRFFDDNGTRIQPYGWIITSSGTCSSGQVSDNDLLGNLTGSYLFTTAPSGGNWVNNAGLASGALASPGSTLIDGPLALSPTTTTTAPTAGGAGALPATPAGYFTITLNGTNHQIPYY